MANKTFYARCKVLPGLFDTEFYVMISNSSAYVDRSSVKVKKEPEPGKEVEGEVLTYLIDERGQEALVELSGEPVVGGLRTWIPKALLASA